MIKKELSELVLEKPLIAVYYNSVIKNGEVELTDKSSVARYHMISLICYYIDKNGGIPLLIPQDVELQEVVKNIDGYLLPGGSDINPKFYGKAKEPETEVNEKEEAKRFLLEETFVRDALALNKPILAICRGMQTSNVILGRIWQEENPQEELGDKGTLVQHLPRYFPDDDIHQDDRIYELDSKKVVAWQEAVDKGLDAKHQFEASHDILILKDTKLFELLGKELVGCFSCHHQGIGAVNLAPQLKACAYSVKQNGDVNYGIIDAAEYKNIMLVQSHPEIGVGNIANNLFANLLKNAKKYKNESSNRQINVESIVDYYNRGKILLSNLEK